MNKWIAEFELEDGDTMPEHMDLNYMGARIDFHCKSLEQELCEDAISRQVAIGALREAENHAFNSYYQGLKKAHKIIADLPPVTPKPKIGQWILSGGYWRCSKCKEKALLKLDKSKGNCREYMPVKSNFCPNCGKNMLGIQTSSERNNKK